MGSSGPRPTLDFKLDFTIRFEDLTFGKLLGQGAYGKVFAGEWKFNPVAIKQYTAQDFSEQTREEIRKEASIMATASAQSDYLVRLRGVILEKPHYSLVMEYLPGGDLFHLLKSSQEMTWPMRYRISLDMTIGLHHLHGHGAFHRDLKSLNVLLDMNFRAKLADFGLSTLKTSSASTTAGGFKGTVLWSAPELFKRGAKASVASDIYSLGMILWELVSRQIPFADAPTTAIAMDWVKSGEQENIPEGTPEEFKALFWIVGIKPRRTSSIGDAVAKRLDTLWQAERKKTQTSSSSSSSPSSRSSSASSSTSSSSAPLSTLADHFSEGKSLVIFSESVPTTPPIEQELKNSLPSPGIAVEEKKSALTLQNELILACEQGNLSAVKGAIQKGAKPFDPDATGKHPIGAAVWGMSPEILDYLLSQRKNEKILTWDDIEKHNRQYYQNTVWILTQFSPENFGDWQTLIGQMDKNAFLRDIHLQIYNQQYQKDLNWPSFNEKIKQRSQTDGHPAGSETVNFTVR